ncbi:DUF1992 domain-containing protein ['Paenibacillus yunnanensis' Narsing Rao et al. 2020]|uniref:DnaJ family domain-containing protein n=1 Tax=Paenibacillus tengchongensis TaxID=2608684 RepID=UPI00124C2ED2|nr:DUF1992 domain-containing protein [Paenibacillus tengchongensis]
MAILSWLAEQRIQEAMRSGEFADLPGQGKPMELEDLSGVPEELRMSFKILKNAGLLPEELMLRQECATLEELLAACRTDGSGIAAKRTELESKLSLKRLRLQQLLSERGLDSSAVYAEYSDQIRGRLLPEQE